MGAVALNASQPLPVTTFPFAGAMDAHAMDAHTQAACRSAPEPLTAPSAVEPQPSATRQQPDEPSTMPSMPAVLAQPPASSFELQQPLMPLLHVNSALQPASSTVDADLDNTNCSMPADAVAVSLSPAPTAAVQNGPAVSMLSSGKRLHSAISQESNDAAQLKDQTEASHEALSKKPKPGQYMSWL